MNGIEEVSPREVRLQLIAGREIALIDLREEAAFATGHPLFAAQIPLSRLELEVLDRIPRPATPIVLYDDGEGLVRQAAEALARIGYSDVCALSGGLAGWRAAGLEVFADVNSYSKAFGELVEHRRGTPSLPAVEVAALIASHEDVVVLDARPVNEFEVMSIPTAVNVPGGELVLRARTLAPDPATRIVVNCAGRTRSLIGAQSLINAGLSNPVAALRNGTIGWTLAGLALDQGATRTYAETPADQLAAAQAAAREVAYRAGVRHIDEDSLAALARTAGRTLYRFDVRSPDEYAAGHLVGFRSAPGGQLVQEIDVFAPVRGARLVMFDDKAVRADMTASWLAQMGWDAYVLDGPVTTDRETGPWRPNHPLLPAGAEISAQDVAERLTIGETVVVDLAPSRDYARGHIPGSWFAIRSQLAQARWRLPRDGPLVLTSPDGALARLAAPELRRLVGPRPVFTLSGGTRAWARRGHLLETGPSRMASDPVDVYRRPYEGVDNSAAAMQAYLDWEYGLVGQLARDASHGFFVV